MTKEDQHLNENEEIQEDEPTLDEERESEENSEDDLDEFFDDPDDTPENETPDEKIKRLEGSIERLTKGIKKLATQRGRENKGNNPAEPTKKADENESDSTTLFYELKPEAEIVREDIKKIAKAKGISEIQVWREEEWLREKAKHLTEEKSEKDKNRGKIGEPNSGRAGIGNPEPKKSELEIRLSQNMPPGFSAEKKS